MSDFAKGFSNISSAFEPLTKMAETSKKKNKIEEAVNEFDSFVESSGVDANDPIIKAARFEVSRTGSIKPQDLINTMDYFSKQSPEEEAKTKAKASLIEDALKSGIEYTDQSPQELARQIREADLSSKKAQTEIQKEKEVTVETQKKARERKVDQVRANLMLSRTQENLSNMVNRQKEINPNFEPGRFGGLELLWSGKITGENQYVNAFIGDLTTTAVALGRIASPGARIGPQFIAAMEKTLPTIFNTQQESEEQLVQSATDAFEQSLVGDISEIFTTEQLESMTPQELIAELRKSSEKFREDFRGMLQSIKSGGESKTANVGDEEIDSLLEYTRKVGG